MKFKPTLGSDYSGKLGGTVASHNTYGSYFRRLVKPVNVKSAGQALQKAAFGAVSQAWRGLTTAGQQLWVASAPAHPKVSRKGDRVILTGQAYFMNTNVLRQRIGLPQLDTPPTGATVPALTAPAVSLLAPGVFSFTFSADEWNAAGGGVIVSVSAPIGNGRNYVNTFKDLAVFANPGGATVPATASFDIPAASKVKLQFHAVTPDGRISQYVTIDVTAASATIASASAGTIGTAVVHAVALTTFVEGQLVAYNQTTHENIFAAVSASGVTNIPVYQPITAGDSIIGAGLMTGGPVIAA